jgi:hypothetical protein
VIYVARFVPKNHQENNKLKGMCQRTVKDFPLILNSII